MDKFAKPLRCLLSFVAVSISTSSVYAATDNSTAPISWASTPSELVSEFCPTSWPLNSDSCTVSSQPTAVIKFPLALGSIIESHLQQSAKSGYYQELSLNDFFHGHLILKGPQMTFDSPESFLANVSLILYHTAEYNNRWEHQADAGIPVEKRTPRSLLGFLDGRLRPARESVQNLPNGYENSGTIYGSDVVKALPWSSSLDYGNLGAVPDIFVKIASPIGPTLCQADSLEFYILERADGRFHAPDGKPIEIFIRCVQNPNRTSIPYVTAPRR